MTRAVLRAYGFTGEFVRQAEAYPQWYPARIVSQEKGLYQAVSGDGETGAEVSGKLRYGAADATDLPAVGDFVMLDRDTGSGGNAIIHRVLQRKSALVRKAAGAGFAPQVLAVNLDTLFICMSLNNDFNLRRLERCLALGWESGATPVVALTKADLCADVASQIRLAQSVAMGAEVLAVSAATPDGLAPLQGYLGPGQTVAMLGSSGVGKSTLTNRLLGQERLATNGLRNDDRGRHTTTRRELILLAGGAMAIDTPGIREIGLMDADEGLEQTFADVDALAKQCRFSNCTHSEEPGCAVLAALQSGELSRERWQSWQKLSREAAFAKDAGDYLARKEEKFRQIAKFNQTNRKR